MQKTRSGDGEHPSQKRVFVIGPSGGEARQDGPYLRLIFALLGPPLTGGALGQIKRGVVIKEPVEHPA